MGQMMEKGWEGGRTMFFYVTFLLIAYDEASRR